MAATALTRFSAELFGHLRIALGTEPFAFAGRRKTLPLLALILLHHKELLTREFAAFTLWPDESEEDALARLRSNIFELGRALPPAAGVPWLSIDATTIGWNPAAPLELDVGRFEAAIADSERLDEALDLYTGDLLESVYEDWLYAQRERLRMLLLQGLEGGIARCWRAGDIRRAIDYAQHLLRHDPFREDIVRRAMALRNAAGDRSGALAEYRKFEQFVKRELAVEPMAETTALRDRILRDEELVAQGGFGEGHDPPIRHERGKQLPMVGRVDEIAHLTSRWNRARTGRGAFVFAGGEAGIGKSRLTAHVANEIAHGGGRVLAGSTSAPEAGPLQAVIEALRSALPLVAALSLEPVWMRALATLIPELADPEGAPLPALEGDARAERLHEAVARALARLAMRRPVLLLLEDVHWASAATIDGVCAIARRLALSPVLIVATYRDDEIDRTHPLSRAMRAAINSGIAESMPVRPLHEADVAALAAAANVSPERASAIYRSAGGNAFFVSQLLASDALDSDAPGTVHAAVAARLERLPEAARHVAEIAALAGTHFSSEVVREVAGWNDAEIGDAIDVLIERRFVRERLGRGPFDFSFSHQLVRDTLVSLRPGTPERHRRVARVLEACHPELSGELALQLGEHYVMAGAPLEAATRFDRAAERALELGAFLDATRAVERGLAVASDPATRARLLTVATATDRHADLATETSHLDELETLAETLDDESLRKLVLVRRAHIARLFGTFEETRAIAARLRARGDAGLSARADIIEANKHVERAAYDEARELVEGALPAIRKFGDDATLALAFGALISVFANTGERARAVALAAELNALAERSVDHMTKMHALANSFTALITFSENAEAAVISQRWIETALVAGDRRGESAAREHHARTLLMAGEAGKALESIERAAAIGAELGLGLPFAALANRAIILMRIGAFAEARELLVTVLADRDLEAHRRNLQSRSALTMVSACLGNYDAARESGCFALETARALGLHPQRALVLDNLAEAERLAGEDDRAIAYSLEAYELRRAHAIPGDNKNAISLALLYALRGEIETARTWLERAGTTEARALAATFWRERFALLYAQAAHACGDAALAEVWLTIAEREAASVLASLASPRSDTYANAWWNREIAFARAGRWPQPYLRA